MALVGLDPDTPYPYQPPPASAPPSAPPPATHWPGQAPPTGTTPPPSTSTPPGGYPKSTAPAPVTGSLDPATVVADWMAHNNPQGHQDAAYWTRRFAETGGLTAANLEYWKSRFMEAPGTHQEGGYGGTNVFSDPATKQWEQLINGLVGKLNTPYTPPGYDPMIAQLNDYFKKLQGPPYTNAQMDLIQTQSTDPLMQARDNARQSILQHFGARGMTPDSGVVQQALEQSDQRYGVANTQNQAQFATNAIGLDRQNQATAAQVGPQIAGLQQGLYNYNLGNQMQGAGYANQVPTTAWNRLTGAHTLINPLNPESLLYGQNAFQQQGYGQTNAWMQQLMQLLAGYFR